MIPSPVEPTVFVVKHEGEHSVFEKASQEWLDDYMRTRTAPLVRK